MRIRSYVPADLPALTDLTIETFRPFHEGYVAPLYGEDLFRLHHGTWEQDYRDELPGMHDPAAHRWIAVADADGPAGLVAYRVREQADHGVIELLAVGERHRRHGYGHALCAHALADLRSRGVRVVELSTGFDDFHSPARGLYRSLGFTEVGIAGYIQAV
jgi:ribosomal protein S18 acetylase RimI-like enzyme